ncbi:MAG: DivIVA domain-containing protein [Iamia sp.]
MAPDHSAASITGRSFAVRRKGFDPDEVRAYLGQLAEVINRLASERDGARGEVSSLQATAEARPEIDEDQLIAVLGEETARVLSSARKAATEMKERGEESVARMLREAAEEAGATRRTAEADAARARDAAANVRLEADEARRLAVEQAETDATRIQTEAKNDAVATRQAAEAEREAADADAAAARAQAETDAEARRAEAHGVLAERTTEAEAAAAALAQQGEAEAARIRTEAEGEAEAIRAQAEADRDAHQDEGREMVAEAQRVRERMLADLARRRKAAKVQLEQLQAGRDRLIDTYDAVQREVDAATSELRRALPAARQAAEGARIRAEAEPADSVDQLEAQIAAARAAGLPLVAPDEAAEASADETDDELVDPDAAAEEAALLEGDTDLAEPAPAVEVAAVDLTGGGPDLTESHGAPGADTAAEVSVDDEVEADTDALDTTGPGLDPEALEAAVADAAAPDGGDPSVGDVGEPIVGGDAEDAEEVDDLFARLKASREDSAASARDLLDTPSDTPLAPGRETTTEAVAAEAAAEDTAPEAAAAEDTAAEAEAGPGDELVDLLERRDGAIEPIENRVARRLKRVLADEQGRVLDGVRRAKGAPDLDEILPLDEQVLAYAAVVVDDLLAAAEEGAGFEGASLPSTASLDEVAEDLGRALAGVVRPRIERCFEAGDDTDDTSDRLRATYREWKTDSLVDSTRHHVLAAFGEGQCAVRPVGAPVRWVPDPASSACPDCEDDALAGAVPSGEAFPTGHAHPPAHPGCRCLVVGERVGTPA